MKKMSKKKQRHRERRYQFGGKATTWIVLVILAFCSLSVVWGILRDNARKMGNEMVQSFSLQGEREMTVYETLMEVCTSYIDHQIASSNDPDIGIEEYLSMIGSILGENVIDPYAVINGEIVAATPWEGDKEYQIEETQWYQKAIAAGGKIIYTDGYQDAITGELVITIAQEGKISGNVVAFDIFPDQFKRSIENNDLPDGSSYVLCDSNGTILYKQIEKNLSNEKFQAYVDELLRQIESGEVSVSDPFLYQDLGQKRVAYFDIAQNGWISIVSMPFFL